jgi:hypothetical protein
MTQRRVPYCLYCQAPVERGNTRPRRYCSDACRQAAYRKRKPSDARSGKNALGARIPGRKGQNTPQEAPQSAAKQEIRNGAYARSHWQGYNLTSGQGKPVTEAIARSAFLARHGYKPKIAVTTGGCWLVGPIAENGR